MLITNSQSLLRSLPLAVLTSGILLSAPGIANSITSAGDISTQNLIDQQSLPDLSNTVTQPITPPPSGLTDRDYAVLLAEQWHPAIGQAVGKLVQPAAKVNVAKAKDYPRISAGMDNGHSNSYVDAGYSPSLVLSVSQMLYDSGKVSSSVRAASAGLAEQQANVILAEKNRDLYETQYLQPGTRPLPGLLNVEQEIYQARFTHEQTQAQSHSLQPDRLYSTGQMRNTFKLNNREIQGVEIRP